MDTGNRVNAGLEREIAMNSTDPTAYTAYDSTTYWEDTKKGPGPRVMAASTLDGDNVVNAQNEKLGDIKEIMIDVPTGRVAYAVLSVGGFLGIGEKLIAVPWRALRLDAANKCFQLNVSKDQVKNAEGFDKDRWPSMADERWATNLHDYYGAAYYWK